MPTAPTLPQHLARHFRQAYTGGSFSEKHLQRELSGLTFQQATTRSGRGDTNSIAAIAYHLHFYVLGLETALAGGTLDTRDAASWDTPAIETQAQWDALVAEVLRVGAAFAKTLAALPEAEVWAPFYAPTNSSTFTNALGVLEHVYYHLGQIVVIRKALGIPSGG